MRGTSAGLSLLGRALVGGYNRSHRRQPGHVQAGSVRAEASRRAAADAPPRDPDLDAALAAIVDGINRLPDLSPWGRQLLERQLIDALATRLRICALAGTLPGSPSPLAPVLFIIGPPRTGTTLLQRLLAADPQARSPRLWELYNPVPAPRAADYETDRRIGKARRTERIRRVLAPGIYEMHPMAAALPEEDVAILSRGFLAATWCGILGRDPQFESWVSANGDANAAAAYAYHRRELAYLQSDFAPTHWVLKSPAHVFGLRALLSAYPDAWVLNTYREPAEWVPSVCQLQWFYRSTVAITAPATLGREVLRWWGVAMDAMIALRHEHPRRFIDVDYRATVSAPLDTIRQVYERTGLEYDAERERRMRQYLERDRFLQHRTHTYRLEHFGLDRAAVDDRFADYRAEFGLCG